MAEFTKIQWCDFTFNPWLGCSKVHAGCLNCYAEADMDKRRRRVQWGANGTRSKTSDTYWKDPYRWAMQSRNSYAAWMRDNVGLFSGLDTVKAFQKPKVFCASLADVFEDWRGEILNHKGEILSRREGDRHIEITMDDLRYDLFSIIDDTSELDWLLLTKRPENILKMWPKDNCYYAGIPGPLGGRNARRNVWLGTSVSDQATAFRAVHELLRCRGLSQVLFLSIEPLIGPVNLLQVFGGDYQAFQLGIDWVIVGGESGPYARPCNVKWIHDIVRQCQSAGVPVFVKQLGSKVIDANIGWPDGTQIPSIGGQVGLADKKGGNPSEWPESIRLREWPKPRSV